MIETTRTPHQEALKQEFHKAEAELIAALNGIGRPVASDSEVEERRQALRFARDACEDAGVEVKAVWESSELVRAENERLVRAFAEEQRSVVSLFPRRMRMRVAGLGGVAAAAGAFMHWPSGWGLLAALIAAVIGFAMVDFAIGSYFPTPGIRVGRMAAAFDLGALGIWDRGEDDAKEFAFGYRQFEARARQGGGRGWIKAR